MKSKNMLKLTIIFIVIAVSLLIGVVVYYDKLVGNLQSTTCATLKEVLRQEENAFMKMLYSDREAIKGYSELISTSVNDEKNLLQSMGAIARSTDFEYVSFATPDGRSINNKGEKVNILDREYFPLALDGKTVVSDPIKSKLRDAYIIAIATPVRSSGEIVGVLVGSFNVEKLNKLFMGAFDGRGYTYVSTNAGEIIAKSESIYSLSKTENLFDAFEEATFYNNDSYEVMRKNLLKNSGGHSRYQTGDQKRLMHYDKLPINNWNIFTIVSPSAVDEIAKTILEDTIVLTIGLILVFIGLLIYNFLNRRRFTRELTRMAYVDDVTGYSSFGKFKVDAVELIQHREKAHQMLLKMDIEDFKTINELYSMEVGDRILKAKGEALSSALDEDTDAFGRVHADEFILLISYENDEERLSKREKFEKVFAQRCEELIDFKLVLPQGRYALQDEDNDLGPCYEKANFAHRLAKSSAGRELDFDGKIKEQALREKEFENRMEEGLLNKEFHMLLQPKYRLNDEKIVGAEALVRWTMGDKKAISPQEFIPLFEKNGFICRIDMYMFEEVCIRLKSWIEGGIDPVTISVNFSRIHLANPTFVEELSEVADRYNVPHHLLEIELTETVMLDNMETLEVVLQKLHKEDFTLSMDDFGMGYSSLGLLKNISVDVIKIDKSFFDKTKDKDRAKLVISSIMNLAKELDICTVAEGVETQGHIDLLRELGCEMVQGFYYAEPMKATDLEVQLIRNILAEK